MLTTKTRRHEELQILSQFKLSISKRTSPLCGKPFSLIPLGEIPKNADKNDNRFLSCHSERSFNCFSSWDGVKNLDESTYGLVESRRPEQVTGFFTSLWVVDWEARFRMTMFGQFALGHLHIFLYA